MKYCMGGVGSLWPVGWIQPVELLDVAHTHGISVKFSHGDRQLGEVWGGGEALPDCNWKKLPTPAVWSIGQVACSSSYLAVG